jgi:ABC-2 type transport system permease protein
VTSPQTTATARAAGTIYDLGYQHYTGERLGRGNAIRTLAAFSFKAAFGRGRGSKAQAIPFIVLILVYLPVIIQIAIASATGRTEFLSYAQYLRFVTLFLALFAAAQAPEVIVADRQYGVLSLYLSRSLGTYDYIAAKVSAFVGAMLVLTLGPQLVIFLGKILINAHPWQAFVADYRTLMPIVGGTFVISCYVAFVALALAAFSARRAFATASVIAFFIFMPAVGNIANAIVSSDAKRYTPLASPFLVITGFANWLFDVQAGARVPNELGMRATARQLVRVGLPGEYYLYIVLGSCAVALALLLLRYRRTEV